ncbi:UvrD-like helicase family protein [Streptomyces sp. CG 926]|uniref:UvrD-helicase domain-containing protein n=1 Tax=Streptomyces sp. CG 926 TaxID=1882405 RepID=UPI000D6A8037|nr:UvrD-helicase domain-containing protein [Streptomyces sp. CG 926]PWK65529.1 UvrD-like helicase family protein [Streptomyces sp. CG 926]
MTKTPGAPPELTDEQRAVVELPWDAKCLVVAGAGAGKTHTLVRRLDALVERDDVLPGEILVLSFSNAAVRELRRRIQRHAVAADRVRVQTFDSWATAFLSEIAPTGEWHTVPFDERIRNATEAIGDGRLDDFLTEDLAHVVVDEVQDLVGDRSRMVEALLDEYRDAGFTVVGDPAQCLYGFQVPMAHRAEEVNSFFPWLRNSFPADLRELRLTRNFRATTDSARTALHLGHRLQQDDLTAEGHRAVHTQLHAALLSNLPFAPLDSELAASSLRSHDGTNALLCTTNGQALAVSRTLWTSGVPHKVQRSAQDRVLPTWLSLLYRRCEKSTLSRVRFDAIADELELPDGEARDVLWHALVRLDGRGHRSGIDLNRVKTALAGGRIPDELTTQAAERVVVSTVHRAKGLEFDRVVVIDPGPVAGPDTKDSDPAAAARALYVAMTRPRHDLYHLTLRRDPFLRKDNDGRPPTGRWYRGGAGTKRGQRYGIEVLGGDVSREAPAGADGHEKNDAVDLQHYLAHEVHAGDPVEFVRAHELPTGPDASPPYLLRHAGRTIGSASETLRKDLYRFRRTRKDAAALPWPLTITDLFLDSVETVVGNDNVALGAGLGERGVWLAPRPTGLGRFEWEKKGTEDGEA